jgi:hypothetical protein
MYSFPTSLRHILPLCVFTIAQHSNGQRQKAIRDYQVVRQVTQHTKCHHVILLYIVLKVTIKLKLIVMTSFENKTFVVVAKVNQSYHTPTEAQGERTYSSYPFLTSALGGDEWSEPRPGRALPPGKGPPEARWAPEPVWTQRLKEKSFTSAGDRTPIARPSSP